MEKLKIAIIGQGRSGRNIHGAFFKSEDNTICQVVAVVERDPQRRQLALEEYPGCAVYEDYRQLFDRDDLDLVVNASFSVRFNVMSFRAQRLARSRGIYAPSMGERSFDSLSLAQDDSEIWSPRSTTTR